MKPRRNEEGWTVYGRAPKPTFTIEVDGSVPSSVEAIVLAASGSLGASVSTPGAPAERIGKKFVTLRFDPISNELEVLQRETDQTHNTAPRLMRRFRMDTTRDEGIQNLLVELKRLAK